MYPVSKQRECFQRMPLKTDIENFKCTSQAIPCSEIAGAILGVTAPTDNVPLVTHFKNLE